MFEKVKYTSLNNVVYERIKENIINNKLKSNEKLDVDEFCEKLGVSKTPVTNALKSLARDGYIVINPRSGTYVRDYSYEEVEAIFDFRLVLESLAVEKCMGRADKDLLKKMKSDLEGITLKLLEGSTDNEKLIDLFFQLEVGIHEYIISLCPKIIGDQIQNLMDLSKRFRKLQLSSIMNDKGARVFCEGEIRLHIELLNAILQENLEDAKRFLSYDIAETKKEILDGFRNYGGAL